MLSTQRQIAYYFNIINLRAQCIYVAVNVIIHQYNYETLKIGVWVFKLF